MKELYRRNSLIIAWIFFAGYVIFNGILLCGHELWRDEANVWLLARDTTPVTLMKEIRYQGHPCLWYLLVMPFAKLGLPFRVLSCISYGIMMAAAGIFVWKAPFHPLTKAVCLFSPVFSYYYPVIARNYCLIALLLMLLAWLYPERKERPLLYGLLLGLLVQSDVIVLAAAGLISLLWLWEALLSLVRGKDPVPLTAAAKGLWIPLVSLGLLLLQFVGVSDSPEYAPRMLSAGEMLGEIRNFSFQIITRLTGFGEIPAILLILLFAAAGLLLSVKLGTSLPLLVAVGEFLYQAVFSIVVYQLHIWHYIAICFTLLWFMWLGCGSEKAGRAGRMLAELFLVVLSVAMFLRWNSEEESSSLANALCGIYSDGVSAAEYISEHIDKEELIVSDNVSEASTVLAYLGRGYQDSFRYAGTGTSETFARYNEEQSREITYEELLRWVKEAYPDQDSFYLLKCPSGCIRDIPEKAMEEWRICYQTREDTARGENYILYLIPLP